MTSEPAVPFLDLRACHAELTDELQAAFDQTMADLSFIGGPAVSSFEAHWAEFCGVAHCVGVANGTDALELILAGLGIGDGAEVVIPANTFVATAEAVARVGATPVFCDVDPRTLLMTPETVEPVLTARTAAIMPVHLYGQPVDMEGVCGLAAAHDVPVVGDAAQAHGATIDGRPATIYGVASGFSFYPGKNLGAIGDAGAIVTHDAELAERIRVLANHGRSLDGHHGHEVVGRNSRLDGLQAAVLDVKLTRLSEWTAARRRHMAHYRELLEGTPVQLLDERPGVAGAYHLGVALLENRDQVREELAAVGIATGLHYPVPCHLQPAFAGPDGQSFPVTEWAAERLLSLPLFPQMTPDQVERVAAELARLVPASVAA